MLLIEADTNINVRWELPKSVIGALIRDAQQQQPLPAPWRQEMARRSLNPCP